MHRRQEAVAALLVGGEAELHQAAQDLLLQLLRALYLGLQQQFAVFLQQRRQLVAAEATAVQHAQRVAAQVGEMLDQHEGEQRQALGGLVDLGA
ncbi:hypothetical protein D3C80_1205060 [compost metagenome]